MNSKIYFWCAVMGLLGALFQTTLKIKSLKDQSKRANHEFKIKSYFFDDYPIIFANLITITAAIILMDEIIKYKPQILQFIKWFFFFIGFTGSSLLNYFLSKTQKIIDAVIDRKTDKADAIDAGEN